MGVAARTIQDGDTAVQLVQDGGTELVRLGADQLDLGTALTPEQDFVQDHDLNDDGHDAVQQLRHRAERDLDEDDGNVKDEHGGGHCLLLVGYDDEHYWFNDPWHNHGVCAQPKALVEDCHAAQGMFAVTLKRK